MVLWDVLSEVKDNYCCFLFWNMLRIVIHYDINKDNPIDEAQVQKYNTNTWLLDCMKFESWPNMSSNAFATQINKELKHMRPVQY